MRSPRCCARCEGGSGRVEITLEDRAGTPVPVRISARRTRLGSDEFICLVVTDLRGQKLQDQLREADQRKNEFLAILGHELRNPLAIIHNVLQVLRKKYGADASADMRGMIEEQTRQMGRLIDDLLDVSRITTGKIRLELARFDIAKVAGRDGAKLPRHSRSQRFDARSRTAKPAVVCQWRQNPDRPGDWQFAA